LKLEILENIWSVILSDGIVDPYEDALFMQIGDLLLITKGELSALKH
jgi:uncharacterized tellurite resistance protein B-like protein